MHCAARLDGDERVVSRSRLVSGALRRPFLGPFTLPLRLLCDPCAADVRPAALPSSAAHARRPWSAFAPSPALFALVHAFKYGGIVELAPWFGARLARTARHQLGNAAAVLVPVPLHPERRRERGFNQSALLARDVGRRLGIPVCEEWLLRVSATPALARVAHASRAALVRDAFVAVKPAPAAQRRVVLVDDVVTTGATTTAALAALALPPAQSAVLCLCVARGTGAVQAAERGL